MQVGIGYRGFDFRALAWYRDEADDLWYTSQQRNRGRWIPTGNAITASWSHRFRTGLGLQARLATRTSGIDEDSNEPSHRAHFTGNPDDPDELRIYRLGDYTFTRLRAREWLAGTILDWEDDRWSVVAGSELTLTENPEDYQTRTLTSEPFSATDRHDERNVALFVSARFDATPELTLSGGLRYDRNDLAGEEGGFGNLVTPRAAAIWSPRPEHTLKLIYAQSFQTPDSFRKFSRDPGVRDIPNPDLEAEKLRSLELSHGFYPSSRFRLTSSLFYARIENLIRLVDIVHPGGTTNRFENTGRLDVVGLETQGRVAFGEVHSAFVNLTLNRAEDPDTGRESGDIAPIKANFGLELVLGGPWSVYARGHWVSDRDTVNVDSDSIYSIRSVDGYFSSDLTISWDGQVPGLALDASIYNVFDAEYYDPGPRSADGIKYNAAIIQEPIHGFLRLRYRY